MELPEMSLKGILNHRCDKCGIEKNNTKDWGNLEGADVCKKCYRPFRIQYNRIIKDFFKGNFAMEDEEAKEEIQNPQVLTKQEPVQVDPMANVREQILQKLKDNSN